MHDETSLPHTQINQICDRFEDAWEKNAPANIADFLAMAPPADRQRLLQQLLPIDIEFRQKTDVTCDPAIYTVLGPEAVDLAVSILEKKTSDGDLLTIDLPSDAASSADSDDSDLDFNVVSKPTRGVAGSTDATESKRIGRYKLLQKIGEGGMGTVWMAEQEEPVRRRVALKVIKTGMDTKQVIARFEAERQALALMDHQNIARVLDAGTTDEGLPYFVMELVKGIPYVDYCNQNRFSIKERLELFVPVCKAIQHAHQKGIIHRDLKPTNVLVTLYDGHPVPKVIDFGLAKALDQQAQLTDRTMFTEFGQVVGTLQYMSPEQAEMNALDVDTRTDVYSLGVMLYELLTGTTPIEMETLQQNALMKVLQDIRETDPPRPSIRLSQSGEAVTGYSEQRKIEPGRLQQLLRGELDWIVMKSLEKDRTRRYETASSFVDDIQRYLADEPVKARPATARYMFGKFVKKHRGLVATIAALTGLLIAGIIGTSYGLVEAQRQTAEVVQEKQRADEAAENARASATVAKQKEAEAATEAEKSRAAEARAKKNEQYALTARQRADKEAENARAAEKVAKQKEAEAATEAEKSRMAEARAKKNEKYALTAQQRADKEAKNARAAEKVAKQKEAEAATEAEKSRAAEARAKQNEQQAVAAQKQVEQTLARSNFFLAVARRSAGRLLDSREFLRKIPKVYRNVEWGLLHQLEGCEMTCYGHRTEVRKVCFTADRSRIVSLGLKIKTWDATTGTEISEIKGAKFDLNPAGTEVAVSSSDGEIRIFDLSGQGLRTFSREDSDSSIYQIRYSNNGKQIATFGSERTIKLWDPVTGKLLHKIGSERRHVRDFCFSADGKWIAAVGSRSLAIWDTSDGKLLRKFEVNDRSGAQCICVSPDGRWIATGSTDQSIKLFDAATGQEERSYTGHTGPVTCVSFNPNGLQIVSGSEDGTVKLWNMDSRQEIRTYRGHTAVVNSVAFSPDGTRIVSGSKDGTVKLWNATEANNLRLLRGHVNHVNSICFSPDGKRIASVSSSGAPKIRDAITGEPIFATKGSHGGSRIIAFKHDGSQIVTGQIDGTLRLWDASNGDELLTLLGHQSNISPICSVGSVNFSPDDTLILSTSLKTLKLWNAATGKEVWTWNVGLQILKDAHFSPDGKQIIAACYSEIKRWDVASGTELNPIKDGDLSGISAIAISADGTRIAAESRHATIKLFDTETGEVVNTLRGHVKQVRSLSFSPDGKRIVSISGGGPKSSDHTVKLWDVATGEELISLEGQSSGGSNIIFSPDGSMIAWAGSGVDNAIKLWDVATAEETKMFKGINFRIPQVKTSDDGTIVTSSDGTKDTIVWDSNSNKFGLDPANMVPEFIPSGPFGTVLLMVDRNFRDSPREKAFRQYKAKLDPSFHAIQAEIAERKKNWYAATFHRAWVFKGDPDRKIVSYKFHEAFKKLKRQYNEEGRELTDFLSPQVVEVAGLPRPKRAPLTISKEEAEEINRDIWQKVKSLNLNAVKNGTAPLSQAEINSLRSVSTHYPQQRQYLTTLMVAEYRLNHLKQNVAAVEKQISTWAQVKKEDVNWSPVELAVLAMSYHKLGDTEKAAEYRAQLDEAMKLEKWSDDEDSKAFFAEANELLGVPASSETDG